LRAKLLAIGGLPVAGEANVVVPIHFEVVRVGTADERGEEEKW